MATSVSLPDAFAERIATEAAKRATKTDEVAAKVLAERFPPSLHRLSIAALGASASGRHARDAEKMLAAGFGRDFLC